MKIISWNVAGLRACLKKGFQDFFERVNADIICLQETKLLESELEYKPKGYEIYLNPAKRKGYSGVMIYTRVHPLKVIYGMGREEFDEEGRMITLELEDFYLITMYSPNSKDGLIRLDYRLSYENAFRSFIQELEKQKPVIFCGDLNVAHQEIDIANPSTHHKSPGFSDEERNSFSKTLSLGYIDSYRYYNPNKVIYTWWSYLGHAREKNIGWRLDYFVVSKSLEKRMKNSKILNGILGSDHCPIELDLENSKEI